MTTTEPFRIAAGSGFAGDRFEPAELLAREGDLDALVFECLAERTIGLAQHAVLSGASEGFDSRIIRRLHGTLPALLGRNAVAVTNAGAANPRGAARAVVALLDELDVSRVPVAAVSGDDVLDVLDLRSSQILGTDESLFDIRERLVSANVYLGAGGIVEALDKGARIVLTGRCGDASLFLAPLVHHFGWSMNDLALMAEGTLVGHLLECAGQLTGGYFADGGRKLVPALSRIGFPFADVAADGSATYGKIDGTGGLINRLTTLEQLLYEIDDPACYLTPDVTLDLSSVNIEETGVNRVRVSGARPAGIPEQLKVSVGVRDGYLSIAEISFAGQGCVQRADLARQIIVERWEEVHGLDAAEVNCDVVGHNSSRPWWQGKAQDSDEVRVRFSVRSFDHAQAALLGEEVEALYTNGPAGGGGVTSSVRETIGIVSTLIPRDDVEPRVEVF